MAKQTELAGVERPKINEVEQAAEDYVSIRDKRMAMTQKEVEAKAVLLDKMHKHKLNAYRYDERIVEVTPKENVKVKTVNDDDGGEDNDD